MLLAALILSSSPARAVSLPWPAPPLLVAQCDWRPVPALCRLHYWVGRTWRAEDRRGIARTRYWWTAERHPQWSPWHRRRHEWHLRALRVEAIPLPPPASWVHDALCVHLHEGAWNSNTGNGYYGGLQMDVSFQQAYGAEYLAAWGTADHWPPVDQLRAAYRAWRVRGWSPWPSTAARCGLL